ncbi:rCG30428, isoform CRA_a [Rattus norvegicus]|uniref:RCG30428, isoform CRA_a n=1 Tax=Rattus norvegicus TaxID=10116 RepID=A6JFR6_RAT|nr:rCG30428, isoform CRA_a [Rattus norvegicus]
MIPKAASPGARGDTNLVNVKWDSIED